MELYREVGFLALSRAQRGAGNLKLSCKGQYRLAVYPCTQCKSQIGQGAKEESDVEIYQKLVISSKSWKWSAPYSPFEKIEIGKLLMKFPIYIKIWSYFSRFWKYDSYVIWVPKGDRKMLTQANLTVPMYFIIDTFSIKVFYICLAVKMSPRSFLWILKISEASWKCSS